ncbi:MAG: RbsD/FucU family protein [Clostridiales bacterium]|nr:RbsD/FucU family protein [Clostridiales bacterium]
MLKNIPPILSPELLKVLAEMGHGDRICIGDGNFPGASMAKPHNCVLVRADGHGVCALLDAILQVIPLDEYVEHPVQIMQVADKDKGMEVPIWDEYKKIVAKYDARGEKAFDSVERFAFYEEARNTYCILQSGETAIYANIILQKGVVK